MLRQRIKKTVISSLRGIMVESLFSILLIALTIFLALLFHLIMS